LEGEPGPAAMSRDGEAIAVALRGPPDCLVLFDVASGSQLWQFTVEGAEGEVNGTVTCLAITPNASYVAAGTTGGDIYLLSGQDGSLIRQWRFPSPIRDLELSELGTFLAAAITYRVFFMSRLHQAALWNTSVTEPPYAITVLAMNRKGSYLAAGTTESYTVYLRAGDGHIVWRYSAPSPVSDIALTADGDMVLTVCMNACIAHSQSGEFIQYYYGRPEAFALAPTGRCLAVACYGTVYLYDIPNRSPTRTYNLAPKGTIVDMALPNDGYTLIAGEKGGSLYVVDTWRSQPRWWLPLNESILCILAPEEGDHFAVLTGFRLLLLSVRGKSEWTYPLVALGVIFFSIAVSTLIVIQLVRVSRSPQQKKPPKAEKTATRPPTGPG